MDPGSQRALDPNQNGGNHPALQLRDGNLSLGFDKLLLLGGDRKLELSPKPFSSRPSLTGLYEARQSIYG